MGLFKRKAAAPAPPTPEQAIQRLQGSIDDNNDKLNQLDRRMADFDAKIQQRLKAGDRNGAKAMLAQKKQLQAQKQSIEQTNTSFIQQMMQIENAVLTRQNVQAMKQSTDAQKHALGGMTADDVADLRDAQQELNDIQQEINEMMGEMNGELMGDDVDDELAEMEADLMAAQFEDIAAPALGAGTALPQAPQGVQQPAQHRRVTEDEELAALMAM